MNMDEEDTEECNLDCDFIRKPKSYHTPKSTSSSRDSQNNKISLHLTPCNKVSQVVRTPLESYINPFTPDGKVIANKVKAHKEFKRLSISETETSKLILNDTTEFDSVLLSDGDIDILSRPPLKDLNVSRFIEEFIVLEEIGKGVYGCVYKCLNRINGCVYAVKRTLNAIHSGFHERVVRNEVYAHGVLNHQNIVRNYSCWNENGFVFIQNEYCNMGSLEGYIKSNVMPEAQLRRLLLQVAHALNYIHKKGLAHMDIKPGNICLKTENSEDSNISGNENIDTITFKLGDFGHITSLDEERDLEEGDCRYLPREILEGNAKHIDKGDIFSLGLTVYEASGGGTLPKNGDHWQEIRNGNLKYLGFLSKEFNNIMKAMIHPRLENRPSAAELTEILETTVEDDFSCMHQYHHNNMRLEHEVGTSGHYLRGLYESHRQIGKGFFGKDKFSSTGKRNKRVTNTRIVGKRTKRSNSTMF